MDLTYEQLHSRYQLLCNASQPNSSIDLQLQHELSKLEALINKELVEITRLGCPANITDILNSFTYELTRFRQFCEFPQLAAKSIVGIGGGFSAGKSTFINKLVGKKCLAVEIDPTTSMPAYVLHGEHEAIKAINQHNCAIDLTREEFVSLTHEEKDKYGSQIGLLLQSAFVSLPTFKWENLAFLDTPGYSKPDDASSNLISDEQIAREQLNITDFILWVVQADQGTIPEQDIRFLSSLNSDIPKLVVLSKADLKPEEDIHAIIDLIKTTLANRGINVLNVVPYSRRKRSEYPLESIEQQLAIWDQQKSPVLFAQNFKRQFLLYQGHIEAEKRNAHRRMNRINKILTMADDGLISHEASALLSKVKQELDLHAQQLDKLHTLSHLFFNTLKKVGDLAGVPLPEPSALELMDLTSINLLGMLEAYAQTKEVDEPETDCFSTMNVHNAVTHLNQLLRVQPQADLPFGFEQPHAEEIDTMLRKRKQTMEVSLTSQPSTHLIHLLRVEPQADLPFRFEQPNAEQIGTMLRKRKQTMEVSLTSQPSIHLIHLLRKQDTTKFTNLSSI